MTVPSSYFDQHYKIIYQALLLACLYHALFVGGSGGRLTLGGIDNPHLDIGLQRGQLDSNDTPSMLCYSGETT